MYSKLSSRKKHFATDHPVFTENVVFISFLTLFGLLHKKALLQSSNIITYKFFAQRVLCESWGLLCWLNKGQVWSSATYLVELKLLVKYILTTFKYQLLSDMIMNTVDPLWNTANDWQMTYPKRLLLKMRRRKDFIQLKVSLKDIIWSWRNVGSWKPFFC